MLHKNFIVLTGHLDEVALPDLIRTLCARRKSGRLQVEYTDSPGLFYFEEGRLLDARLGDLRGLEALYLSLSLPGASFNFNPLVKPPEQTFSRRELKHVQELLEGARTVGATDIAIPEAGGAVTPLKSAHPASISRTEQPADAALALTLPETQGVLNRLSQVETALTLYSRRFSRERAVYAAVIALLLLSIFVPRLLSRTSNKTATAPVVVATRADGEARPHVGGESRQESAPSDSERRADKATEVTTDKATEVAASKATEVARAKTTASSVKPTKSNVPANSTGEQSAQGSPRRERPVGGEHVVQVSMKVEQGRVVEAAVKNPRAGMASYEALALRMARQRRYPEAFNGADTLQLKVKP